MAEFLFLAAQSGDSVDLLLEGGVDVNAVDENGNTALHFAAANGHVSVVEELVQRGGRLTKNAAGSTPLHWAVVNGERTTVDVLLGAADCDVFGTNGSGKSAVHLAERVGEEEMAAVLLKHKSATIEELVPKGEEDEKKGVEGA